MTNEEIEQKLNNLADLIGLYKEKEAEFKASVQAIQTVIDREKAELKAELLPLGKTVKTDRIMAVYSRGYVRWDPRYLDGYAVSHPEILQARSQGEPTVNIRLVGESKG